MPNANDGRKARFPANVAGRMVYKRNYIGAFKKLFETSVKAWSENETQFEGHKAHPNIRAYHQYVNKFTDAAGEHYVRFTVREDNPGKGAQNNIHGAEVTSVEVYEKGNDSTLPEFQTGRSESPDGARTSRQDRKLALFFSDFNPSSVSKVVDENGEPLVVWHGSDLDGGIYPGAIYTADERDVARSYRKNPYGVFVNIRNPRIVDANFNGNDDLFGEADEDNPDGGTSIDGLVNETMYHMDDQFDGPIVRSVVDAGDGTGDGIPTNEYIPFNQDSSQVKSATDNAGTFSARPDIRHSGVRSAGAIGDGRTPAGLRREMGRNAQEGGGVGGRG